MKISAKSFLVFFSFLSFGMLHAQQNSAWDPAQIYDNIEFDMPEVQEPQFPKYEVNIVQFGAVGDGLQKNTEAFKKAIADVAENGGGKVVVPRGMWLTGPIHFRSNINLHLEDGAFIFFSKDFDDYELIKTSFEGLNTVRNESPINANNVENIAITGKGVIDGSGGAWRPVKKGKMTSSQWDDLVKSGGVLSEDQKMWFPTESAKKGYNSTTNFNVPDKVSDKELALVKDFLRPVMVSIVNSKKILLDGPTFQNSPAWNIHPLMSEDITIRNLTVRNPWYSQNGDGLDLESCKNVVIYNNTFDVGDDAICFKSGKNEDGRERGIPTENVIVKNNIVYHGHGGFVIGSEMSGGVKNVHVSNCTFMGTDVGLRFKSTRGRGGVVEKIYISNINMINIPTEAIRFNLFYGGNSPILEGDQDAADEARDETVVPVTEETPSFRDIYMKNITATNSHKAAFFMGLPEMKLKDVYLKNAIFETEEGITVIDVNSIGLKNVKILQKNGPALVLYNVKDVQLKNINYQENKDGAAVQVSGKSENIDFSKSNIPSGDIQQKTAGVQSGKKGTNLIEVRTATQLIKAIDHASPGDSIFVHAGDYVLKERIYINDSGTASNKIYLVGSSSGERPKLDFSAMEENSSNQGIVLKADNWYIKGFQFYKAGDNGLHIRGNNNLIEFCSFSECADTGLQLDDAASKNTILNCDSFYNADSKLENADGFAVKMDVGSGNKFIGCRAWNNLDDGWDGYLREADNIQTTYENCWAFNNGYLKDGTKGKGDGNGFKTGGSDNKTRKHNASYYRCMAVNNVSDGFDHNSNRGTVSIINCSATGNGRNLAFSEKNGLAKITIINSLVLGELGKYNAEVEEVKNNSWQMDLNVSENDFVSTDISELSAPRKKDGSLPDIGFMRPQKNSKLVNAGVILEKTNSGEAPDLGALESGIAE
ncbi:glycosyl hydrolase family 28 protein [Autumnicola edwardsiae]|uniref:Glycosyl hydrolase family 28 protein n=1 Tax=Autumnicola edwardsiae TaxID=3075594 RepID=A0ABU3CT35_9FLAO|nr:glycosyl hydrolase family 28 protein [Zunongwangia sp. F297]MDT0649517.1 glycosyl hydrolase family 28 protein [Zunongwangia sp. F297]